jgi:hypothetical protein
MHMPIHARLTRIFLWISVIAWGVLLGGKLFDLRVLAGAWSAAPPESLRLLPYGPNYPVDTGEYFFPSSVALLICSFGALVSGWRTPRGYRTWLALPPLMMVLTAMQNPAEIAALVQQWIAYDWVRIAMGLIGLVSAVRAISVPFPETARSADYALERTSGG